VRWLLLVLLGATLTGCANQPADHGADIPGKAREALDCPGHPWQQGSGNYDTGPESVQDDARTAVDDWLDDEGAVLPDVEVEEAGREGRAVLFTWREGGTALGSFVVHDDMDGTDGDRGWGVYSYAFCDPAEWPPGVSDAAGYQVWSNADGDRVPTSLIYSWPGSEHCGWEGMTYLFLGSDGRLGEFYGTPDPELQELLATTYAEHTEPPADARDTGYQRDGRELWVAKDGTAAYLVGADGDAERWPGPAGEPIRCM
jgi:hypothetical protein